MSNHSFILNGKKVSVDVEDDVGLLWVLRDVLKVRGPKYGCAINQCKSCTSHLNGKAFTPCSVSVKYIKPTDRVTTIEVWPTRRKSAACTRCRKRGSSNRSRNAGTASRARSWPRPR